MESFEEWKSSATETEIATELINRRQRQILVHSFLYYQLDQSTVADHTFDRWSRELSDLKDSNPEEFAKSVYAKHFRNFDGSSGFDLPYNMPHIQGIGIRLLKYHGIEV